ncbi:MAG TPA: TRAP transporter substrate-binding protein [Eoetvoesiella sp.]
MPPVHIAGYQGSASILTRSIQALVDRMTALEPDWEVQAEYDVTLSGETSASMYRSVDSGARQVCYIASGYLSARVPDLAALDLPFCVGDRGAALLALDGDAGRYLTFMLEQQTGYKVLGYWDNGFRHISNGVRPIMSAQDCKGLTIRTLDSAGYRDALAAMGFTPKTTDVKDLVRMVQSREVDAQENPLTNFVNFGLWRHHPYVSMTGHIFGVLLLVCNKAWFAGLAPRQQDALLDASRHSTQLQREMAAHEDEVSMQHLVGQGVEVIERQNLDIRSMRQATRSIIECKRKLLPKQLVSSYLDQVAI